MKKLTAVFLITAVLCALAGFSSSGMHAFAEAWRPNALNADRDYVIKVQDQNGEAVAGVYVNICSDTLCVPSRTDEKGEILYTGAPLAYHLQVLKVPEGYVFDPSEEIYTEEDGGETVTTIVRETEAAFTYVICVQDQNGDPVPDVSVNICTDTFCTTQKTDVDGRTIYTGEPAIYHLQIVRVPEGYRFDRFREDYTDPISGEITLKVTRDF